MDGTSTAYGYGWGISGYGGRSLVEHGGGINGFRTHAIRIPDDRVFVAVVSNNGGVDPEQLAFKIAASVIGQPYKEPASTELSPEVLAQYQGVYKIDTSEERRITLEDNRLFSQRGQAPRLELVPFSSNEFFFKDHSLLRLCFIRDADEAVYAVEMRGRSGIPQLAKKIDELSFANP
jgi:hypothetical protein